MADPKNVKKIREMRYANPNLTQGLAYFQTQNFNHQTKLMLIAEVTMDNQVELGLLGAFRENPLVLKTVLNELTKFVDYKTDELIDLEFIEIAD